MTPSADIVQSPPTQNGSHTPDTAQIEDILQMAAQMVHIQPLKRALYDVRHVAQGFPLIQM
jgi:hypothetical protein